MTNEQVRNCIDCGEPTHDPELPRIHKRCSHCTRQAERAGDAEYLDDLSGQLADYQDDDPEAARIISIMAAVEGWATI